MPGDRRGFRTRWHREHVEGDYKNPPPKGKYEKRFERSRAEMKREPVLLEPALRWLALDEFRKSFEKWNLRAIAVAVGEKHFHVLAQCPDHKPRHWIGLAKKESSAYLKIAGHAPQGGLWATKCECKPIRDRAHHIRVFKYVLKHAKQGAAVWNVLTSAPDDDFPDPDGLLID